MYHITRLLNLSRYFLVIVCINVNAVSAQETKIVIENKGNNTIYVMTGFSCYRALYIDDEKIFFINLSIDYDPSEMYGLRGPDLTYIAIAPSEIIEMQVNGTIDLKKYEITEYPKFECTGFSSTASYYLYYAIKCFSFAPDEGEYKDYINDMRTNGFITIGYYDEKEKRLFFKITPKDIPIDDDAIFDIKKFIEKVKAYYF
ncbi:MAG: hypothetical protein Ta2B_17750 [Termitinemataceae bacterium]|nr:MAG: hypothetical protein Ta2B_17750 [Termitinemataceae bacterium]